MSSRYYHLLLLSEIINLLSAGEMLAENWIRGESWDIRMIITMRITITITTESMTELMPSVTRTITTVSETSSISTMTKLRTMLMMIITIMRITVTTISSKKHSYLKSTTIKRNHPTTRGLLRMVQRKATLTSRKINQRICQKHWNWRIKERNLLR